MRYSPEEYRNMSMPLYDLEGKMLPDPVLVSSAYDGLRTVKAKSDTPEMLSLMQAFRGDSYRSLSNISHELSYFNTQSLDRAVNPQIAPVTLKIMLAYARVYKIPFISINEQDLIAPDSNIKIVRQLGLRFAWELARKMQIGAGCGNGVTNHLKQYQIKGYDFILREHHGIWDPQTETKISERSLYMAFPHKFLDTIDPVIDQGREALVEFFDSEYVKEQLERATSARRPY